MMVEEVSLFGEASPYGPKPKIDPRDKVLADGTRYPRGLKGRPAPEGANKDGSNLPSAAGNNPNGAPPLDWWVIEMTKDQARQRVIRAMCPDRVCRICGEPSRRIVEKSPEYAAYRSSVVASGDWNDDGRRNAIQATRRGLEAASYITTGFTDCGHDDWRPGVVFDPFNPERVGPFILELGDIDEEDFHAWQRRHEAPTVYSDPTPDDD